MPLEETWEAQQKLLRPKLKKTIRTAANRLDRDVRGSAVTFELTTQTEEPLEQFFALHRARANARRGPRHINYFYSRLARTFMRDAARAMAAAGHLNLSILRAGGRPIAMRINLRSGGDSYSYFSGFDPLLWESSPMTILSAHDIKEAISSGDDRMSFSPGVDGAKARWPVQYEWITAQAFVRDELPARMLFFIATLVRRLKELVRRMMVVLRIPAVHLILRRRSPGW